MNARETSGSSLPLVGRFVFILFVLEAALTLSANYLDSLGEEGLKVLAPFSFVVAAITITILFYVWKLLVSGKKFLLNLTCIFLAINVLPMVYLWSGVGFTLNAGEMLSMLSTVVLVIILAAIKSQPLSRWLIN